VIRLLLAVVVLAGLSGCVTTRHHNAVVAQYRAVVERQSLMCSDSVRLLITEKNDNLERIAHMEALLKTQVVTNEEILKAARDGRIEKAKRKRESSIHANEK
jgi:hypothetical protein